MQPGDIIGGKYKIVGPLGHGGMGAIYEARHLATDRRVAIKVIAPEDDEERPELLARLWREARAGAAIESQHVAQVLDMGTCDQGTCDGSGDPYLVLEYLAGRDLHIALSALGPLPSDLALRIAAQACVGLAKAHEAGVIHRDIKPPNVFLADGDAGEVIVKLLDFGIAKVDAARFASRPTPSLTLSGSIVGSPYYMSPEQARGPKSVDHRTDIWSLGVVLYEMLSGVTPFVHCRTLGPLIYALYAEEPPPLRERAPWVSPEVAAIVDAAVTRDPDGRFQSARDMLDALHARLPQGHALHESMFVPLSAQRPIAPTERLAAVVSPPPEMHGTSTASVAVAPLNPPPGLTATPRGIVAAVDRAARHAPVSAAAAAVVGVCLVAAVVGSAALHGGAAPRSASPLDSIGVMAPMPASAPSEAPERAPGEPTVLAPEIPVVQHPGASVQPVAGQPVAAAHSPSSAGPLLAAALPPPRADASATPPSDAGPPSPPARVAPPPRPNPSPVPPEIRDETF